MAGKKAVRRALLKGIGKGLSGADLYGFVKEKASDLSNKEIVHAALFALTDPDISDRKVLDAIYALAIKYRLGEDAVDAMRVKKRPSSARRPAGKKSPRAKVAADSSGK